MGYGNILIICVLIYYTMYFFNMFMSGGQRKLVEVNTELNKLRKIPIKTLEEQKKFLDMKYPKITPTKWKLSNYINLFFMIIFTISIAMFYNYIFGYYRVDIGLGWGILLASIIPFLLNLLLSKFKLDSNDLLDLFKK